MEHQFEGITWHLKQYQLLSLQSQPGLSLTGTERGNLCICVEGPWLFVIHNGCVIENISMLTALENVKGTWNGNVLMINVAFNAFSRQFSVTFMDTASESGANHCRICITHLQKYFKFFDENGSPWAHELTLPETFKHFMQQHTNKNSSALAESRIPDDFPVEDTLKLIIADPGFAALVARVQRVFESLSLQDTSIQPLQHTKKL